MLESFFRGAANSGTLGFGDELVGEGVAPLLKILRPDLFGDQSLGDIYAQTRDIARQQNKQSAEAYPYANIAGNIAGMGWLPFPAFNVKNAAAPASGLGAAYGALYGLGNNEDGKIANILRDMALGTAVGYTAGGGLYGGGKGWKKFQKELEP